LGTAEQAAAEISQVVNESGCRRQQVKELGRFFVGGPERKKILRLSKFQISQLPIAASGSFLGLLVPV
jgi:hypothetical protein